MKKTKALRLLSFAFIAASIGCLLHLSWFRWGNLIIDTFRDQWIFYKLSEGKVLYKDLFYIYGFFPPYVIAFLYKILGVKLIWQVIVGVIVTSGCSLFVYRIARLYLNRFFALLATLNFIFVFAFGCYSYSGIFNFILPYSIASTFFILFVLAACFWLIKFIRKESRKYILLWAVSIFLAYLSRFDITFAVWAASVFIGLIYAFSNRRFSVLIYFFLPAAAAFISYWVFLYFTGGFPGFKESLLPILRLSATGQSKFDFFSTGLSDLPANLNLAVKSFCLQILAAFVFYLIAKGSEVLLGLKRIKAVEISVFSFCGLISFLIAFNLAKHMTYFHQFRLIPIVLVWGIFFGFWGLFKKASRSKSLSLLGLFLISLVLALRVLFRASPNHYGFFLLVPGIIAYYCFLIDLYPGLLNKIIPLDERGRRCYYLCISILLIVFACFFVKQSRYLYGLKTFTAVTDRARLHSFNDLKTKRFWQTVVYMKESTPRDSTLAVFPEGIGINFFSGRDNPLRYHTFLPPQIKTLGQDYIVQQLKDHDIDYIIILARIAADYQQLRFGADYGKKIYSRIEQDYRLEKVIGPYPFTSREFGVAIFRKK